MKSYERALAILGRVVSMHRLASGPESLPVADDFSRMAQIYMEMKTVPGAIGMLNAALQIRTRLVGPLDPSLVPDLDRLAGAHIVRREYDKAEEAYRRALVIRETLLGRYDADLIATVDGLAYACFGQKKYDEAEPIYQRLLDLWVRSLGPEHPMVGARVRQDCDVLRRAGKVRSGERSDGPLTGHPRVFPGRGTLVGGHRTDRAGDQRQGDRRITSGRSSCSTRRTRCMRR